MDEKHLILEQYRMMIESKEEFTDRSFQTNRFYFIISIVLLITISFFYSQSPEAIMPIILCAFMGIISAMLLYSNLDTYQHLIKIKYQKVLDEIEKLLPLQPMKMEKDALETAAKDSKHFRYVDTQKLFAVLSMLIFLSFALVEIIPFIMASKI